MMAALLSYVVVSPFLGHHRRPTSTLLDNQLVKVGLLVGAAWSALLRQDLALGMMFAIAFMALSIGVNAPRVGVVRHDDADG